ncbi:unnamed protein product [Symbiodinium natans]|uniref:Uncharacterized protein n=1 Tax=Symbiodinium natans TaxID=878477 RepID=A0A812QXP7_9DINO|nr:unnamed protein product [Symbiodinium natans]
MAWPSSASENPLAPRVPGDVLVFKTSADAGWELQANLTQIASQNVTLPNDWVSNVALSSDIVVAFGVDGLSCIYTFKRDGASWIFLGKQCVPDDTTSMALGGDLLVLGDYGSQTFQLQGSIWSLVPTAELQGQSSLYKTDGRTLAFLGDVVSVYHWAGSFWSNVATIPAPSNPVVGLGVDVDGDYIIAAWMSFADANYVTVIYEEQGGLWPEVFRINHGDRQPTLVGVSSSGKAVVGRADAYFSTVTIIEVGSNGTWAVTQSFNFDRPYPSAGFASAAISATSLALAEWVPIDAIEQRSVGRILACNSTALSATTSVPLPHYRPYYRRCYHPRCRRSHRRGQDVFIVLILLSSCSGAASLNDVEI